MKPVMRYSEAFKLHVVESLSTGRFKNPSEASAFYGITGQHTVQTWVRKYGNEQLLRRVVRIQMPQEKDHIKELKKRIRQLEKALAEAKVDEIFARAQFEVACEELGVKDIESFKKKLNEQLSAGD